MRVVFCYTYSMFNKTFYKFLFGFLAVIAGTLVLTLVVGATGST